MSNDEKKNPTTEGEYTMGEGMGGMTVAMECSPVVKPLGEQLKEKRSAIERKLADVNEAIAALEANPEIERVLNLVGKAGRF